MKTLTSKQQIINFAVWLGINCEIVEAGKIMVTDEKLLTDLKDTFFTHSQSDMEELYDIYLKDVY